MILKFLFYNIYLILFIVFEMITLMKKNISFRFNSRKKFKKSF